MQTDFFLVLCSAHSLGGDALLRETICRLLENPPELGGKSESTRMNFEDLLHGFLALHALWEADGEAALTALDHVKTALPAHALLRATALEMLGRMPLETEKRGALKLPKTGKAKSLSLQAALVRMRWLMEAGAPDRALAIYAELAVKRASGWWWEGVFTLLGDLYARQDAPLEKVLLWYEQALEYNACAPDALMGMALKLAKTDTPRVHVLYRQATEACVTDARRSRVWAQISQCHLQKGDVRKAVHAARQAVALSDGAARPQALYALGNAELEHMELLRARDAYQEALCLLDNRAPLLRAALHKKLFGIAERRLEGELARAHALAVAGCLKNLPKTKQLDALPVLTGMHALRGDWFAVDAEYTQATELLRASGSVELYLEVCLDWATRLMNQKKDAEAAKDCLHAALEYEAGSAQSEGSQQKLVLYAHTLAQWGDIQLAQAASRRAAEYFSKQGDTVWHARALDAFCAGCLEWNLEAGRYEYDECIRSLRETDAAGVTNYLLYRYGCALAARGQHTRAAELLSESLSMDQRAHSQRDESCTRQRYAEVLENLGQYEEALAEDQIALDIRVRNLDIEEQSALRAHAAKMMLRCGRTQPARQMLEEGIELCDAAERESEGWLLRMQLAQSYEAEDAQKALRLYDEGIARLRERDERAGESMALYAKARACAQLGQHEQALALDEAGLALDRALGSKEGEAGSLIVLAQSLLEMQRYEEALAAVQEATEIRKRMPDENTTAYTYAMQGVVLHAMGRGEASLEAHGQALARVQSLGDLHAQSVLHLRMAETLMMMDAQGVEEHLRESADIARQSGNWEDEATALRLLGISLRVHRRFERALDIFGQGLDASETHGDALRRVLFLQELGLTHSQMGKADSALALLGQAVTLSEEAGGKALRGAVLHALANIQRAAEDTQAALESFQEVLALLESAEDTRGQSVTLHEMGTIHLARDEARQALWFFRRGYALEEERNDLRGQVVMLQEVAECYRQMGSHEEAERYYALALEKARGNPFLQARLFKEMGEMCGRAGDVDGALGHFEDIVRVYREAGNRIAEAKTLSQLGKVYWGCGRGTEAVERLQRSAELLEELGDFRGRIEALQAMAEIYKALGKGRLAMEALRKCVLPGGEAPQGEADAQGEEREAFPGAQLRLIRPE